MATTHQEALMNNPLWGIRSLGQSVWYDNLGRDLLESGELRRLIEEDGVSGVTSNPTIFEKAIGHEKIYDRDLHTLVDTGMDLYSIYQSLAIADIREAADLLKPVYDQTAGDDGYVSLEVSPHLAHDPAGTVAQAKRLFETVARENLMVKVPATPEGLIAVERLIASGVNVNITLIFSLEQYRNTAEAYIKGLTQWIQTGGDPRRLASVASFFVSRVDSMVDERLAEVADASLRNVATQLMGKAAIANAKLAYVIFKEIFHGERFADLKARGARGQRVLWASTSTKNPKYPDTYYVDALIGAETVNTMPAATLTAFREHGQPVARLEHDLEQAREVFDQLGQMGINIDEVMEQLLENGVKSFADSFDLLMEGIAKKRTRLLRGWGHRSASLGTLQKRVDDTLNRLDQEKLAEAIWTGDVSVWGDDPESRSEIAQRLGWLQIVETMIGERQRLSDFADEIKSAGFTDAVVLGMGGSSLAPEVFATCFGSVAGYLKLHVLDSTVPGAILDLESRLDLERTLFVVASKSGGTVEVNSLYKYFKSRMDGLLGKKAGQNFIAITDPGTCLGKLAAEEGFRKTFLNPPDIGGRFSALSYFGLVPAALIGMDLDRLLMRASQAVEASGPIVSSLESPGAWLGVIMAEAALAGRDKLTLTVSDAVKSLGYWLEQLVAESTGKQGKGILPVEGEPLGNPESYGNDRLFMYLRVDGDATYDEKVSALEAAGHPVVTLRLHGPYDIGREMFRWEYATAVAGTILKINAFDQPNVKESKDITNQLLDAFKRDGKIPEGDRLEIDAPGLPASLSRFAGLSRPGEYLALNAFIRMNDQNIEALQKVRVLLRDRYKIATTLGFGPRYLHSTGQIHKGGAETGLFLLITVDDEQDIPIPGEAYSFGVLKTAQSMGDLGALKKHGRKVLAIHLKSEADLSKLVVAARTPG